MRHWGKISKWDDERGFGFISSYKGGASVFFHVSSLRSDRRPTVNESVSYILTSDSQGRPRANAVRFVVGSTWPWCQIARRAIAAPMAFAVSFLITVAALAAAGWLEVSWLAIYYGASTITYFSYSHDKTAAQNNRSRIPESTLHLMSLIGGWPGALIAQVLLRHKTRKPSFLIGYWFTVIVNCIALIMIVDKGLSPVKAMFGAAI